MPAARSLHFGPWLVDCACTALVMLSTASSGGPGCTKCGSCTRQVDAELSREATHRRPLAAFLARIQKSPLLRIEAQKQLEGHTKTECLMQIRFLPQRRSTPKRRPNRRWIECPLFSARRLPPDVTIELWLLDASRHLAGRACPPGGEPIVLGFHDYTKVLERKVARVGEGLYRLVARDTRGRIRARRDFEAAFWLSPEPEERTYKPRSEVERVSDELKAVKARLREAEQARDAALQAAERLTAAVAERDAQIELLEDDLDAAHERITKVRRLNAQRVERSAGPGGGDSIDRQHEAAASVEAAREGERQGAAVGRPANTGRRYIRAREQPDPRSAGESPRVASPGRDFTGGASTASARRSKAGGADDIASMLGFVERAVGLGRQLAEEHKSTPDDNEGASPDAEDGS